MSMNRSFISGRVGKKPVLKKTNSNVSYTIFSVATVEKWKDKATGKKMEHTDWQSIKCWRKLAELICEWVVQGQYLEIIGKNRCDIVEVKNDKGEVVDKKFYRYIEGREVEFMQKPKAYWDALQKNKSGTQTPATPSNEDGFIPPEEEGDYPEPYDAHQAVASAPAGAPKQLHGSL